MADPEPVRDYTCVWITYKNGKRCYYHQQTRMGVLVVTELERVASRPASSGNGRDYKRMAQRKLELLKEAGYQCKRCGETQCLTIDHITPLLKTYGKDTKRFRNKLDTWDYGELQVLCTWCHREKDGWDREGNTLKVAA